MSSATRREFLQLIGAGAAAAALAETASAAAQPAKSGASSPTRSNATFKLSLRCSNDIITAVLEGRAMGFRAVDGPCIYRARRAGSENAEVLQDASVEVSGHGLVVRGNLAGLDLEQTFTLPRSKPYMEERIVLQNHTRQAIALSDLEIGLTRPITGPDGLVIPELAGDHWTAVPLRHRADDPPGQSNDYSVSNILTSPGWEPAPGGWGRIGSPRRFSEGWAWVHGASALGIFRFCQEHLQYSIVTTEKSAEGTALRFGGACMMMDEPAALTRLQPGHSVDLGITRYQMVAGGWEQTCAAFRAMLDEKGCHFPGSYNPPVHWEQLYDMEGAWDDRLHRYTKATLQKEAEKANAYSCEALYLDPGWDTGFGTFIWGKEWLGPRKQFIREMKEKYGLGVALHCPLATWMSFPGMSMGPFSADQWPAAARRAPLPGDSQMAPAVRDGHRNLALLPTARATASSVFEKGSWPIHQIPHLIDGWYGNSASWIAGEMPAWADVDLGGLYRISEVRLGNEHFLQYTDRAATDFRILVSAVAAGAADPEWETVADLHGEPLTGTRSFTFTPVEARQVRIEITKSQGDLPRLDEIEIYESQSVSPAEAIAFQKEAHRGPKPPLTSVGPLVCLGSRQYLDEAAKRLLANCADGAVFLMFDGNWWNGGCWSHEHGHPVPYCREDHIHANVELARRVHERFPKVLIEMHDMLAGGNPARPTPVYYKYGLPGSYDENWGFELMWDPMSDLKAGRALALYDYNLGCNIPIYLHIDLRKDNQNCVVLWWYASTCRHLGIGGTHADPAVVKAQQEAMSAYHRLEEFYKRGVFYGINEQVHVHILPSKKACIVNIFNLSDQERVIEGSATLESMGLDPALHCQAQSDGVQCQGATLSVSRRMPPWSAQVVEVRA